MSTGMQLVDAIRNGEATPPSGIRTLGLDQTHHWITELDTGRVVLRYELDGRYENLEGAVICSWVVALADQAMFFAANTLCGEGEGTRMEELHLHSLRNITNGPVRITAAVVDRQHDRMFCTCEFVGPGGEVDAHVTATIRVLQ